MKIEEASANPNALLSELRRDVQLSKKRPRASSPPPENVSNGKYVTALTGRALLFTCGGILNAENSPLRQNWRQTTSIQARGCG